MGLDLEGTNAREKETETERGPVGEGERTIYFEGTQWMRDV